MVAGMSGNATLSDPHPASDSLYHETRSAMGTDVEVYLYAPSATRAAVLMEAVFAEIERVEAALSTYRAHSELSRINRSAGATSVTTDPETFGLLRRALAFSAASGGAFDITVGPLVRAWGFSRGEGRLPTPEELAEARSATGWRHVLLDDVHRAVRFGIPGLQLDLGGVGKGWALDSAAGVLRDHGVTTALIGAGRSSYYALGAPPRTEGWLVAVPDPTKPGQVLSTVRLRDGSLSTSGNSEKYFDLGGRRYSHIIDPRTGEPSEGTLQVTVTAASATVSDALSTTLFVLGPAEAAELIGRTHGAAALLVADGRGNHQIIPIHWTATVNAPGG
jgi:thiamine biosynthesis lipoprotein